MYKIKKSFYDWCVENDNMEWVDLWDYDLNDKTPHEIGYASDSKRYFKCKMGLHESTGIFIGSITKKDGKKRNFCCKGCNSIGQFIIDKYGKDYLNEVWSDKNNKSPFEFSRSGDKKIYLNCLKNKNHKQYIIKCSDYYNGRGCNICANRKIIKGVNDIATTHPEFVRYFANEEDAYKYSFGSRKELLVKCPNCGCIKTMTPSSMIRYGFSCQKCGDGVSYPNKFMFSLLKQLGVDFEVEYSPKWIKPKRYDFYLPDYKIIIEMDGGFHFKHNKKRGLTKDEILAIDKYKDCTALENGIYTIRIDCNYEKGNRFSYIVNSINNNIISKIFNLDGINYKDCDEYATTSVVKNCCELFEEKSLTISEISKITKLHPNTVRDYLKIGNRLNLCNYRTTKHVFVYKDNVFIGEYNSCKDTVDYFNKEYLIKLSQNGIRRVASGHQETYKGYVFTYKK